MNEAQAKADDMYRARDCDESDRSHKQKAYNNATER